MIFISLRELLSMVKRYRQPGSFFVGVVWSVLVYLGPEMLILV
jgi:hypothetical protein